jgi:hypothetical protein
MSRTEGGTGGSGSCSNRVSLPLHTGRLLVVVLGIAAASGERREGEGPVLGVATVGEGRRRGRE